MLRLIKTLLLAVFSCYLFISCSQPNKVKIRLLLVVYTVDPQDPLLKNRDHSLRESDFIKANVKIKALSNNKFNQIDFKQYDSSDIMTTLGATVDVDYTDEDSLINLCYTIQAFDKNFVINDWIKTTKSSLLTDISVNPFLIEMKKTNWEVKDDKYNLDFNFNNNDKKLKVDSLLIGLSFSNQDKNIWKKVMYNKADTQNNELNKYSISLNTTDVSEHDSEPSANIDTIYCTVIKN